MSPFTVQTVGRILLLRFHAPVDGSGPSALELAQLATKCRAKFLVVDATSAPYSDSNGVRWLMKLRQLPIALRIAAKPGGRIWRALKLLGLDQDLFDSMRQAWRTPWRMPSAAMAA